MLHRRVDGRRGSPSVVARAVRMLLAVVAAASLTLGLAACGGSESDPGTGDNVASNDGQSATFAGGQDIEGKKVLFLIYTEASNFFWRPSLNGIAAAEAMTGLDVQVEYGDSDDAKMVNKLQTAIAQRYDGIAVSIPTAGLNKALCDAHEAGIPVVAFNNAAQTGEAKDCVLAYVGQDGAQAGELIASKMIEAGRIEDGAHGFCPVEYPNAVYADLRYSGVMRALETIGATCELTGVGPDTAPAQDKMTQYLLGHRDTDFIINLGGTPNTVAAAAMEKAGVDVPAGGFDLGNGSILRDIKAGKLYATVDQQPYSQGFLPVMQLALYLKFGLYPADISTGGNGLVDSSNVDQVLSLVPDYR
ncbi:MAG TPA: substrate-binding domain-containing protein [Conexibacter sp.]